jgi:hypothetical protein
MAACMIVSGTIRPHVAQTAKEDNISARKVQIATHIILIYMAIVGASRTLPGRRQAAA